MIVIIDHEYGGAEKVAEALIKLNCEYTLAKHESDISGAGKIIIPGIEQAGKAVRKLHLLNLFSLLRMIKKPILGIGLGMQLMSEFSEEGDVACLGIFPGTVEKFEATSEKLAALDKLPVEISKESPLFKGIENGSGFYFCNKYYLKLSDYTTATANNGVTFTAALEKDNFYGVQFHPELSGQVGLNLLNNFCNINLKDK